MEQNKANNIGTFWKSLWGFLATVSIGLLIFLTFALFQSIFLILYGFYLEDWNPSANIENMIKALAYNGDAISVAEIPAAFLGVSLVILFTSMRKPVSVVNYLQLTIPPFLSLLKWLGLMVLIIVLMDLSYTLLEKQTPDFMTEVYSSSTNIPLLWFAVIIAAPFFEEFLFRGYLLEGIRQTPIGSAGAIVITAASWAVIHLQYQSFEVITIFLIGIVFGVAKLKTQSLYVPIAMHMLMNLTASMMMEIS